MKVFLDSDVLLDYLTGRNLFLNEIKLIIDKGVKGEIKLFTSSLVIANIYYFISKIENKNKAKIKIEKLSRFLKILNVGETEIMKALKSKFSDFEDAIQNECTQNFKMDVLITRNHKDFKHSKLPILSPKELVFKL